MTINNGSTDKDSRKERESADPKSAVKAPAKKDGHGGGYTWEGPSNDATVEGFVPHDPQVEAAKLNNAARGPNKAEDEADLFALKQNDFPALGKSTGQAPSSPARNADKKTWERNIAVDKDLAI